MSSICSMLCCCAGKDNVPNTSAELLRWQQRRNKEIERELRKEAERRRRRQMILLLGTGESGKSTFLKQMKIINGKRFSAHEMEQLRDIIYDNIYKGVLFLLQARENLDIPWETGDQSPAAQAAELMEEHFRAHRAEHRERVRLNTPVWSEEEFLQLVPSIQAIWADGSIRKAFDQRSKIITENFSENTRYYLNRLHYIGIKDYVPTDEDIVWSRKPTTSIIEEEIVVHNASLVFVDVGGQTKERRKWCHCFSDVTSILFLVACSHYDEHYQDKVTKEFRNKLREAMIVFEGLINHAAFRRVSIIIFFNKTDILKEKVSSRLSNIRDEFPNFPAKFDPFKLQDVQNFMVEAFASLVSSMPGAESLAVPNIGRGSLGGSSFSGTKDVNASGVRRTSAPATAHPSMSIAAQNVAPMPVRKRMLYRHFTTAVDRRNIETVFHAMQDTVLQNNLRRIMMG
ncbi:hypothetical protein T265_10834 [Opisthorchis viverrini]|uniref:G-protein alpha subunit n=1 Tax=Opisthorchis viverrini TaxID=6198 RepID=A0A074Z161_OPIVI|nr:hypothetical protein T265_10834 [Opisthorchis viverrini]KER20678.1 hypothetical protein T265_10834 [Opisthorchis viverrini]